MANRRQEGQATVKPFVVVNGIDREDCLRRLRHRLDDLTLDDINDWTYLWLEHWEEHRWCGVEEVPRDLIVKRIKDRAEAQARALALPFGRSIPTC